jgi:hypothetical protein
MREDEPWPPRPDGQVERLPVLRPWDRPTSYASTLPRAVRGQPALPLERRARSRPVGDLRGRLVDLVG